MYSIDINFINANRKSGGAEHASKKVNVKEIKSAVDSFKYNRFSSKVINTLSRNSKKRILNFVSGLVKDKLINGKNISQEDFNKTFKVLVQNAVSEDGSIVPSNDENLSKGQISLHGYYELEEAKYTELLLEGIQNLTSSIDFQFDNQKTKELNTFITESIKAFRGENHQVHPSIEEDKSNQTIKSSLEQKQNSNPGSAQLSKADILAVIKATEDLDLKQINKMIPQVVTMTDLASLDSQLLKRKGINTENIKVIHDFLRSKSKISLLDIKEIKYAIPDFKNLLAIYKVELKSKAEPICSQNESNVSADLLSQILPPNQALGEKTHQIINNLNTLPVNQGQALANLDEPKAKPKNYDKLIAQLNQRRLDPRVNNYYRKVEILNDNDMEAIQFILKNRKGNANLFNDPIHIHFSNKQKEYLPTFESLLELDVTNLDMNFHMDDSRVKGFENNFEQVLNQKAQNISIQYRDAMLNKPGIQKTSGEFRPNNWKVIGLIRDPKNMTIKRLTEECETQKSEIIKASFETLLKEKNKALAKFIHERRGEIEASLSRDFDPSVVSFYIDQQLADLDGTKVDLLPTNKNDQIRFLESLKELDSSLKITINSLNSDVDTSYISFTCKDDFLDKLQVIKETVTNDTEDILGAHFLLKALYKNENREELLDLISVKFPNLAMTNAFIDEYLDQRFNENISSAEQLKANLGFDVFVRSSSVKYSLSGEDLRLLVKSCEDFYRPKYSQDFNDKIENKVLRFTSQARLKANGTDVFQDINLSVDEQFNSYANKCFQGERKVIDRSPEITYRGILEAKRKSLQLYLNANDIDDFAVLFEKEISNGNVSDIAFQLEFLENTFSQWDQDFANSHPNLDADKSAIHKLSILVSDYHSDYNKLTNESGFDELKAVTYLATAKQISKLDNLSNRGWGDKFYSPEDSDNNLRKLVHNLVVQEKVAGGNTKLDLNPENLAMLDSVLSDLKLDETRFSFRVDSYEKDSEGLMNQLLIPFSNQLELDRLTHDKLVNLLTSRAKEVLMPGELKVEKIMESTLPNIQGISNDAKNIYGTLQKAREQYMSGSLGMEYPDYVSNVIAGVYLVPYVENGTAIEDFTQFKDRINSELGQINQEIFGTNSSKEFEGYTLTDLSINDSIFDDLAKLNHAQMLAMFIDDSSFMSKAESEFPNYSIVGKEFRDSLCISSTDNSQNQQIIANNSLAYFTNHEDLAFANAPDILNLINDHLRVCIESLKKVFGYSSVSKLEERNKFISTINTIASPDDSAKKALFSRMIVADYNEEHQAKCINKSIYRDSDVLGIPLIKTFYLLDFIGRSEGYSGNGSVEDVHSFREFLADSNAPRSPRIKYQDLIPSEYIDNLVQDIADLNYEVNNVEDLFLAKKNLYFISFKSAPDQSKADLLNIDIDKYKEFRATLLTIQIKDKPEAVSEFMKNNFHDVFKTPPENLNDQIGTLKQFISEVEAKSTTRIKKLQLNDSTIDFMINNYLSSNFS